MSRRLLWKAVLDIAILAGFPALTNKLGKGTYAQLKTSAELQDRESVKRDVKNVSLKGWIRNEGDEAWELDRASVLEPEKRAKIIGER